MESATNETLNALSIADFKQLVQDGALILDTRPATVFTTGYIPGSIFIGLEGSFEEWATAVLPRNEKIVLIATPGTETTTAARLNNVSFAQLQGYLDGGFEAWIAAGEPVDMIIDIEADELAMDLPHDRNMQVVDVRRSTEFAEGHVKGAVNIPLHELSDVAVIAELDELKNLYIHCAAGYRSVIAASILKKHGLHNLRNILGGWNKIKEQEKIAVEKDTSALN